MADRDRISIRGGRLVDPANGIDALLDLHIADGQVVALGNPPAGFAPDRVLQADGQVVCAEAGGVEGTQKKGMEDFGATFKNGVLDTAASATNASVAMVSLLFIAVAIVFGIGVYRIGQLPQSWNVPTGYGYLLKPGQNEWHGMQRQQCVYRNGYVPSGRLYRGKPHGVQRVGSMSRRGCVQHHDGYVLQSSKNGRQRLQRWQCVYANR